MRLPESLNGLVYGRPDGTRFKLGPEALGALAGARQSRPRDVERGGVLLGRYLREDQHVVVDEVTLPSASDQGTRTTFRRTPGPHQRVIEARWVASAGTCVYLGEWHTHPEPTPHPSAVDLDDWRRHLRVDRYDAEGLFFAIVGTREICVWEGRRSSPRFSKLPLIGTLP